MPRRPGRPRLDEDDPSVPVSVRLPSREYDELYERAQRERTSIPEIIRRHLRDGRSVKKTNEPEG